jgi:hypothetical protein
MNMRTRQNARHSDEAAPSAARDPDALGPQSAALILELQRLSSAFDSEIRSRQRGRRAAPDASARPFVTRPLGPGVGEKAGWGRLSTSVWNRLD